MKSKSYVVIAVTAFGTFGCNTSRDITLQSGTRTDYVVGQHYQLKKPVFLFKHDRTDSREVPKLDRIGSAGTPQNLDEFLRSASFDPHVVGLLVPGDQVRVTKITEHTSPTMGKFLDVLGVISSGDNVGRVVELSLISEEGLPSCSVFVSPEYLVPVKK